MSTWEEISWEGPKSNDLLVVCETPSPVKEREVFSVTVTVNNISDNNLVLTLVIGGVEFCLFFLRFKFLTASKRRAECETEGGAT